MPQSSVILPPSRIRKPATSKTAAPTPAQRKARAERNSQLQTEISNAIDEWMKSTLNTASELARRFNKKERYFLDIFFQGGAHLIHKQTKVNAYNAFKHLKAEELRDGETFCDSIVILLIQIHILHQMASVPHYRYSTVKNSRLNTRLSTMQISRNWWPTTQNMFHPAYSKNATLPKLVSKMSAVLLGLCRRL